MWLSGIGYWLSKKGGGRVNKSEKLKVLQEIQENLEVSEENLNTLPSAIRQMVTRLVVPPGVVSIVFSPLDFTVQQVVNSDLPRDAGVLSKVAKAILFVAEQYNQLALEVAKNDSKKERMDEDAKTSGSDES